MQDDIIRFRDGRPSDADVDVVTQLFGNLVWEGDLLSKDSRDWLVQAGFAVRKASHQTLTPEGIRAALKSPRLMEVLMRRYAGGGFRTWERKTYDVCRHTYLG